MNVHKNFINAMKSRHTCHKFYIKSVDSPKLLRPLRKFSRFEFFKFCEFWNLPIYPDLTNLNVRFQRNRLRLQSLPYLKNFFNLNLFKQIDQIQKMINFENEYFQLIIQKLFLGSSSGEELLFRQRKLKGKRSGQTEWEPSGKRSGQELLLLLRERGDRMVTFTGKSKVLPNQGNRIQFMVKKSLLRRSSDLVIHRHSYRSPKVSSYNIFYFPKILQYRLLHYFLFSMRKKLSFNEILCLFQKLNIKKK